MKLDKTKLKQIILEVLREEEQEEEMIPMIKVSVEEVSVESRKVSEMEGKGYSVITKGNVEVEEVDEMVRNMMKAYKAKKELQQEPGQEDNQEST